MRENNQKGKNMPVIKSVELQEIEGAVYEINETLSKSIGLRNYKRAKSNNLQLLVAEYEVSKLCEAGYPILVSETWNDIVYDPKLSTGQAVKMLWEKFPFHMRNIREYNEGRKEKRAMDDLYDITDQARKEREYHEYVNACFENTKTAIQGPEKIKSV